MGNVVLINPFEVPLDKGEDFVASWSEVADYMRRQPGFQGTRLHRALSPEARFGFINVAESESPQHFQAAVTHPQFQEMTKGAPPASPSLYEVVRSIEAGAS